MTRADVELKSGPRKTLRARIIGLQRTLTSADVISLTFSALSPVRSVFVTGAIVLHMVGSGAAAALMLGGVVAILGALIAAELGAAFPKAGGLYPGIIAVLGPNLGLAAVALGLITAPATLALGSLGLADYIQTLLPGVGRLPIALAALVAASFLATLNISLNARIVAVALAIELMGLAVLVGVGLHPVRSLSDVLAHPVMVNAGHVLVSTPLAAMPLATLGGVFACSGASLAIFFSEDLRGEPRRIGVIVALVAFGAVVLVASPIVLLILSASGLQGVLSADAPVAAYLVARCGQSAATVVTLLIAGAILNNIIASLLAFSRLLYATGRDNLWPGPVSRGLSKLHPRFGSPWIASGVLGLAAALLCLLKETQLLIFVSGEVFTATMVVAAVVVGRRRGLTGVTSFRIPGYPLTPLLGFALIAAFLTADWMDPSAGRPSVLFLFAVAVGVYSYSKWVRRPEKA